LTKFYDLDFNIITVPELSLIHKNHSQLSLNNQTPNATTIKLIDDTPPDLEDFSQQKQTLTNPQNIMINAISNNSSPRKSEFVGNQPKKPKIKERLKSDKKVHKIGKKAIRAVSTNFNPVSRQTSYRGDSFGDEGSTLFFNIDNIGSKDIRNQPSSKFSGATSISGGASPDLKFGRKDSHKGSIITLLPSGKKIAEELKNGSSNKDIIDGKEVI
jgi:hypothetical protein